MVRLFGFTVQLESAQPSWRTPLRRGLLPPQPLKKQDGKQPMLLLSALEVSRAPQFARGAALARLRRDG